MATLAELTKKYNLKKAKYEPNPNCRFCKGTGEKETRRCKNGRCRKDKTFCICLFVDHEVSNEIGQSLSDFAKRMLQEMKAN